MLSVPDLCQQNGCDDRTEHDPFSLQFGFSPSMAALIPVHAFGRL